MRGFVITLLLAATLVAVKGRASFIVEATSETFTISGATLLYNFPLATHGDLLIHAAEDLYTYHIRRRDADGIYQLADRHVDSVITFNPLTNGKHVAAFTEGFVIWKLDGNSLVNVTYLLFGVPSAKLFDDDTLVIINYNSLVTYQYVQSNNTWNVIQVTEVPDLYTPPFIAPPLAVSLTAAFSGNYFFAYNSTGMDATIRVLERQADLSWNVIESVPWTNSSNLGVMAYNGNDTLAVANVVEGSDPAAGHLTIFTKVNGQWQQQNYDGADLGIDPLGSFGGSILFSNQNTLWMSAPTDGSSSSGPVGKIYALTRNSSGLWEPIAELSHSNNGTIFGMGVTLEDDYIVTVGCNKESLECNIYSTPACLIDPVNVTCHDQQATSCAQVDVNSLYTINNPQCGSNATSVSHVAVNTNNKVTVQYTFTKGNQNATCTATVSCPATPITPTTVNSSPNAPNVSTANVLAIGLVTLVTSLLFLL